MTTPVFTAPPPAPSRLVDNKATYVPKADAFAGWLVTFAGQIAAGVQWIADQVVAITGYSNSASAAASAAQSAAIAAAGATGYFDTLSTNVSCTVGAKALTLDHTGKSFANNQRVSLVRASNAAIRLSGLLSASNMVGPPAVTTLTVDQLSPAAAGGPFNDWFLILDAFLPPLAASAADERAGTDATKFSTPKSQTDAAAFITLTDASTVAWVATDGFNARVTVTGNRLIGTPSGLADGETYTLHIVQGAGGPWTPSFSSAWELAGVAFSATAGKEDKIVVQYNAARGKLEGNFRKAN